jgi:hypothetical protein
MTAGTALVLDGHGWATRAVVRSLGSAGWRVLAPAGTKSARSGFCAHAVAIPDFRRDVHAFASAVGDIIRREDVSVVAPGEDGSLEILYATPGLLGAARVLGGDRDSAFLALDKASTLEHAQRAGFAVPRWHAPESVAEAVEAARDVGFPCVIKPRRSCTRTGSGMRGARLAFAASPAEVVLAVERFTTWGFAPPLVQAWVPGRSIGVAMVLRHGRILGCGAREAFSQLPIRGGSAVWRATVPLTEPGVQQALELMRSLRFEGLGDVQYHIGSDGTPTLMEIGARTYGWLPLTIAAGADLPLIAVRALFGEEPETMIAARPGLHMRWPRGELSRLAEAARLRVQLPPTASRRDVVRQLWPLWTRTMLYDGIRPGDRAWRRRRGSPGGGSGVGGRSAHEHRGGWPRTSAGAGLDLRGSGGRR